VLPDALLSEVSLRLPALGSDVRGLLAAAAQSTELPRVAHKHADEVGRSRAY
jgi:hypothetical protein